MSEHIRTNRWAIASMVFALAPIALFVVLVVFEAVRHAPSHRFEEVFYASVPIGGLAALACALVAWRRPGGRIPTIAGVILGSAEVAVSLLVVIGLRVAFDTLGAA